MIENILHKNYEAYKEKQRMKDLLWEMRKKETMRETNLRIKTEVRIKEKRRIRKEKRLNDFLEEYKKTQRLEIVGKKFGVTKERVRQVLAGLPEYHQIIEDRIFKPYTAQCLICGKEILVKNKKIKKYCSRKCFASSLRLTPEEKKESVKRERVRRTKYANWYYHNVLKKRSDFQNIIRGRNKKYKKYRREYYKQHAKKN